MCVCYFSVQMNVNQKQWGTLRANNASNLLQKHFFPFILFEMVHLSLAEQNEQESAFSMDKQFAVGFEKRSIFS